MVNKIDNQENIQILGLNKTLMQLKKSDLDKIRKLHDIKGVSNLNKTDLAEVLTKQIPIRLQHVLSEWDVERYGILKKAVEHAGVVLVGEDLNIEKAEYFMEWGILFPASKDNRHILFMPKELLDVFSALDHRDLEQITRRNDEWILLTNGLLHYYGFMDIQLAIRKIKELTGQELPVEDYFNVIAVSMDYYFHIGMSVHGLYHLDAEDEMKIIEEHKFRSNLDYYPFTKKQLLKAGKVGYFDSTPQTTALIKFLEYYYNMAHEDADFIVQEVVQLIKNDHSLNEVMTYLESQMEFPNFEILENLTALVAEIHNHTRMWVLKGYYPHELSKKGVKPDFLPPVNVLNSPQLPQRPTGENRQDNASSEDNVVDLNSRRKVGRNDPCPCGSGKKYKKCCGK